MKFEIGKTYATPSIVDADYLVSLTIAARTAKTIRTTEGKTLRIGSYLIDGAEFVLPWGRHSMCPIITAGDAR